MRWLLALLLCGSVQAAALQPRDINGDGTVDAFYDSAQNITFAADTDPFDEPSRPGRYPRDATLGSFELFGISGWRAPRAIDIGCSLVEDSDPPRFLFCAVTKSELSNLPSFDGFRNLFFTYWIDGLIPVGDGNVGPYAYFTLDQGRPYHGSTNEGDVATVWPVHDGDIAAIPEPETWALMLLMALGCWVRRSMQRRTHTRQCLARPDS